MEADLTVDCRYYLAVCLQQVVEYARHIIAELAAVDCGL